MARATQTLTFAGNPANAETVTIGAKVYTFQTTLTDVDGNVDIGADAEASIDQLVNAINLGPGAGTQYAAATVRNPYVSAAKLSPTELVVTARLNGVEGNEIAVAETGATSMSWGAAALAGGTGSASDEVEDIVDFEQVNSSVFSRIRALKPVAE